MAVYEANIRSLAEFISDTKLGFKSSGVRSTTGYRNNGSKYMVSAHEISSDRIYITNDCFIDTNGNMVVTSYIPAIKYYLVTNELSSHYRKGEHLSFDFKANSQVLRYEINKDIELKSYEDFQKCIDNIINLIGQHIEKSINDFKGNAWKIEDVVCNVSWQVDRIKIK